VKLSRRYRFSASHRLQTAALSAEENQRLYGKCNNPYGHGHDYVLDVTLEGPRDGSGQVANRAALDALVAERVLARLDHKNLNADVAELAGVVPTTENLASSIREMLVKDWPLAARLQQVRVSETDRNIFELEVGE
jgi:6-pyruvoyltetrahydropterin/6-carboxytetrahydropterin synthase